jgi:hypothetical protein
MPAGGETGNHTASPRSKEHYLDLLHTINRPIPVTTLSQLQLISFCELKVSGTLGFAEAFVGSSRKPAKPRLFLFGRLRAGRVHS